MEKRVRGMFAAIWALMALVAAIFLSFLLCPNALAGQTASDTIIVEIRGNITSAVLTADIIQPFYPGDTCLLRAVVLDEDGDGVPAVISFFSEDTATLRIVPIERDDYPAGQMHALGIALKKGAVRVWVMAEPIGSIQISFFRNGALEWGRTDAIVGEEIQACAYLIDADGYLLGESPGAPVCPIVFPTRGIPGFLAAALLRSGTMPVVDRALSWRQLEGFRRAMRVGSD